MSDFLERLRQKPPQKRRLFALLVSGGFIGVVFVVWVTMLVTTVSNETNAREQLANTDSDTTILRSLTDQLKSFSAGLSSIAEQFREGVGTTAPEADTGAAYDGIDPGSTTTPSSTATSSFMESGTTSENDGI